MMKRNRKKRKFGCALAVAVLILFLLGINGCYVYGTGGSTTVKIKRLDRKIYSDGESSRDKYLVFTEENGVFENTDSLLRFKFNSSDVQGTFDEGKRYRIHYYGWRVPFLSWYPNIYKVEEIPQ